MDTTNPSSPLKGDCPNKNISRLLEMLDNPDAFTEQEIHDIINGRSSESHQANLDGRVVTDEDAVNHNDEPREAYRLMVAARQAYRHKQSRQAEDAEAAWKRFEQRSLSPLPRDGESLADARQLRAATPLHNGRERGRVFRIAAIFIAAAFLGGLVFAAYRIFSPNGENQQAEVSAPSLTGKAGGESSLVRFTDVRLDSILAVVGRHYGCEVCFRDTALRELRLYMTWNTALPLDSFVSTLNQFDRLRLVALHDTLFVESLSEEAEQ